MFPKRCSTEYGQCDTSLWRNVTSIGAGNYNISGLRSNGTVLSAGAGSAYGIGANSSIINCGQGRTERWSDIKEIAVTGSFVVGLKNDGSFVTCGDAIKGQISSIGSASDFLTGVAKNVLGQVIIPKTSCFKRIYAGSREIIGYESENTIASINNYGTCSSWRNIVDIVASDNTYYIVGIKKNGTVICGETPHGSSKSKCNCDVSMWTDIVDVAIGGEQGTYNNPFIVGLKSNGTVVAVGDNRNGQCDVFEWRDIVAIAAGIFHTVGLKADGTVVSTKWKEDKSKSSNTYYGQCDTAEWTDIVAVFAGDNHTVGLKSDGTVVAVGRNDEGQCNVQQFSEIGVCDSAKAAERKAAEEKRMNLEKIKKQVAARKSDFTRQRDAMKKNFNDDMVCLNCGRKYPSAVVVCKGCGARNESGMGRRGVKYRKITTSDAKKIISLCKDGWIDVYQTIDDNKIHWVQLDNKNKYGELDATKDYVRISEDYTLCSDGRFYIKPLNNEGLFQELKADGTAHFYYVSNGKLNGLYEIISPGGIVTRSEYVDDENKETEEKKRKAIEKRVELLKIKEYMSTARDESITRRKALQVNYADDTICLNCGEKHTTIVEVCSQCSAIHDAGVGKSGVRYRQYHIEKTGVICKLFQDGYIDYIELEQDGRRKKKKLRETNDYYEFYINADGDRNSEAVVLESKGKLFVLPEKEDGLCQELDLDGTANFYYTIDKKLHGKYETISQDGIYTESEYSHGRLIKTKASTDTGLKKNVLSEAESYTTSEEDKQPLLKIKNEVISRKGEFTKQCEVLKAEYGNVYTCLNCRKKLSIFSLKCKHCGATDQSSKSVKFCCKTRSAFATSYHTSVFSYDDGRFEYLRKWRAAQNEYSVKLDDDGNYVEEYREAMFVSTANGEFMIIPKDDSKLVQEIKADNTIVTYPKAKKSSPIGDIVINGTHFYLKEEGGLLSVNKYTILPIKLK